MSSSLTYGTVGGPVGQPPALPGSGRATAQALVGGVGLYCYGPPLTDNDSIHVDARNLLSASIQEAPPGDSRSRVCLKTSQRSATLSSTKPIRRNGMMYLAMPERQP
jgi:hypothetical protein